MISPSAALSPQPSARYFERLAQQIEPPPVHLLQRVLLPKPNTPDPISRAGLNNPPVSRPEQHLPQLLVPLPLQLPPVPLQHNPLPRIDPRLLVKPRDLPPQRLDTRHVSLRRPLHAEDLPRDGGIFE